MTEGHQGMMALSGANLSVDSNGEYGDGSGFNQYAETWQMWSFFHGWRQKTGCVTLVMACVVMGLWVRAQTTVDLLMVTAFGRQVNFISGSGAFMTVCGTVGAVGQKHDPKKLPQPRSTGVHFNCEKLSDDRSKPIAWKNWSDSSLNIYVMSKRGGIEIPLISYVSIVLPLTLVSAYLILSKPRKRA